MTHREGKTKRRASTPELRPARSDARYPTLLEALTDRRTFLAGLGAAALLATGLGGCDTQSDGVPMPPDAGPDARPHPPDAGARDAGPPDAIIADAPAEPDAGSRRVP